ncbi:MAG: hypothetical protein ACYC3B_08835 [Sedimentisphaerales bacterium]
MKVKWLLMIVVGLIFVASVFAGISKVKAPSKLRIYGLSGCGKNNIGVSHIKVDFIDNADNETCFHMEVSCKCQSAISNGTVVLSSPGTGKYVSMTDKSSVCHKKGDKIKIRVCAANTKTSSAWSKSVTFKN